MDGSALCSAFADPDDAAAVARLDAHLATLDAAARVRFMLDHAPGRPVLSSSFGAQAALSLHLVTREAPGIPVILIDTGYLFPETYRFVDQLTQRLKLNLHVYRAPIGTAWFEARYGRLWEQGRDGIERYNGMRKVEPMRRALDELDAGIWFAGLRRSQSATRADAPFVSRRGGRWKVHPVADWSDRDVGRYLAGHRLPYHPLWDQGYVSIGDVHSTVAWKDGMSEADTRFFGLQRECGLHTRI